MKSKYYTTKQSTKKKTLKEEKKTHELQDRKPQNGNSVSFVISN